jgi:hypothetical protein
MELSRTTGLISRGRLIKSMLATGALAACGGKTGLTPIAQSQLCTPVTQDLSWLDQALANSLFSYFDSTTLLTQFDKSQMVQSAQAPYFQQSGQQVQSANVITQIPSAGITIASPGTYTFAGNLTWSSSTPYTSAITITSSNVTLNLNGYTLTAAGSNSALHTAGIVVKGPVSSVVVTNGTVASFTEYGVLATDMCGLDVSYITVTGLNLNDLTIRELTPSGIFASYSQDVNITHCTVSKSNITTDAGAGIQLIRTNQSVVSSCMVQSLVNNAGGMQGYSYLLCENTATLNCTADTFQTFYGNNPNTSGHTCIGFLPTLCFGATFSACTASNMTGCCDDCHGLSVFLCVDVNVRGFQASNILDGVTTGSAAPSGAKATGVEVYCLGSVTVSDSTVTNIKALNPQDLQAAGFSAWGLGIQFQNCSATNVQVQNDNNVADMRGIGFGWAPDPRPGFSIIAASTTTYANCQADTCDVGFDTWYHEDSTWTGTSFTNCTTGYLVEPFGTLRTLKCNPCSECSPPNLPPVSPSNPFYTATLFNIAFGNTVP